MDYGEKLLLFFFSFLCLAVAQPIFRFSYCVPNAGGNYSANSLYEANLKALLSSLSSNIGVDGFYNASAGQNADRVNAVALCRGDVELDICRSCVNDSTHKILQICPNYKEAIAWYDYCMLRYTNRSIFGILETSPAAVWNPENVSGNVNQFNNALSPLLETLRGEAAAGGSLRKFATGNTSGPDFMTIYGLSQCTPDLSEQECVDCLANATSYIPQCCSGRNGARILEPNCNIQYEMNRFFNETPAITAPSSPGNGGISTARILIVIVVSTVNLVVLSICILCIFLKKQKHTKQKERTKFAEDITVTESLQYDFSTIQASTDNFSDSNKLGQGGFGSVYKGRLPNGQEIAVKRLSRNSRQGDLQLKNEVVLVAKLQHRNLVRLLGFCLKGEERLLIYEFEPNASLDHFIFDPSKRACLDWDRRYKIIVGMARGLLYLHEDSRLRIIHRDLKASNVLLDEDMNPKIADFGMARLFMRDETQGTTSMIVGTFGYMAPEYATRGLFSVKSDVFSFGVLVLEIVSGQRNNCTFRAGEKGEGLLACLCFQAWENWQSGTISNIVDPLLRDAMQGIIKCIHIALLCIQENVESRPTMASVVVMLNNSFSLALPLPKEPAFDVNRRNDWELQLHSDEFDTEAIKKEFQQPQGKRVEHMDTASGSTLYA